MIRYRASLVIKNILNSFLGTLGYEVKKKANYKDIRHSLFHACQFISSTGFAPETIIDVGVAKGTPELTSSFPKAYFLLIEPLKEFENDIKKILEQYRGHSVFAAAGAINGEATFNVHSDHIEGSSLYKETMGSEADGNEITVPVVRLDDIVLQGKLNGPFLLKIDVQGAELDVLDGFVKGLCNTEVVVLEVSMFRFMKSAPDFYDVISYMKRSDFVAYDIIKGWNRPLDNALGQVDIIFVKENGMFRKNHSYA